MLTIRKLSILALTLGLLTVAGCADTRGRGDAGPGGADAGGGGGADGGGGCGPCASDEVCVAGACTRIPSSCPCPIESYCDLTTNMCVVGCTSDAECSTGRICDVGTRQCMAGCREDAACGAGQICEPATCRPGCRGDGDCGAGEICDETTCRAGCVSDTDCAASGQVCDEAGRVCRAGCRDHAECPFGEICDFGSATCIAGCLDDTGCGDGEICTFESCVPGCREGSECPSGVCSDDVCQEPRCGDRVVNTPDEQCDGSAPAGSCSMIHSSYAGTATCTSACRLTNTGCCITSGNSCATGPTALPCCGGGCGFGGPGRC